MTEDSKEEVGEATEEDEEECCCHCGLCLDPEEVMREETLDKLMPILKRAFLVNPIDTENELIELGLIGKVSQLRLECGRTREEERIATRRARELEDRRERRLRTEVMRQAKPRSLC